MVVHVIEAESIHLCGVELPRSGRDTFSRPPLSVKVDEVFGNYHISVFGIGEPFGVSEKLFTKALERAEILLEQRLEVFATLLRGVER